MMQQALYLKSTVLISCWTFDFVCHRTNQPCGKKGQECAYKL